MEKKPLVVVAGSVREDALSYLAEHVEIKQWKGEGMIPREVLKEWIVDADGVWLVKDIFDEDILSVAKQLKVVAQASVGYDNADIDALTAHGIPYGNTPDVLTETVAEFGFALALTAARRIVENVNFVKEGKWLERPSDIKGFDLSRRTIGIMGLGRIGFSIARRAAAFGMDVIYCNRCPREDDAETGYRFVSTDELYEQSDVVLSVLPLTEETTHLIDREAFKKMKKSALFVNVGRGKVVNSEDLKWALETGEIDYAALDVVDPEPYGPGMGLLETGKCLMTAHIASFTDRTRYDMAMLAVNNIIKGVNGEEILTPVNPEVYKK